MPGLRVDGWVDCWGFGGDLVQMPALSHSTMCLANATGGVVCYANWRDFVRGTFSDRSTALDGVVVRSLGAVDMYSSDRQICGLDEAGALHCQSDLAAPENVTGTKIVGNGYFFCAMQQAAPSSVACWAHDDDPYGAYSFGPRPEFRALPENVGVVYDMDAWGWGGAFCVLNATKMVHCYNHFAYNNGPVMDYVDNSVAPYSEVAVSSQAVCAVREETGTLQCWGRYTQLPNGQRPEDLGRVGGIAMGGRSLCVAATTTSTTTTASTTSTTMTTTSTSSTTTASSSSTTSATMTTVTSSSSSSTSATSTSSSTGTTTTTTGTETATTVTSTETATSRTTSRTTSTSTRTATKTVSTSTRTATSTSSTTGTSTSRTQTTTTRAAACFGDICVKLEISGARGKGALAALASMLLLGVV